MNMRIIHSVAHHIRASFFSNDSADTVFESRGNEQILRHDVDCLRHSNKELMKTVKSLLAKNSQLSLLNEKLEAINSENIQRMSLLEDDVAEKRTLIDEMSVGIKNRNTSLDDKIAENLDLVKRQLLFKAESDEFRITIQDLKSKVANSNTEVENLKFSKQEVNERNAALEVRVQEVSAANIKLKVVNNFNEDKNAELLNVAESVTKSLNDEKSSHERAVKEMKRMLQVEKDDKDAIIRKSVESFSNIKAQMVAEMSALNSDYAQQLSQLSSTIDTLVHSKNENILRINTLEDDVAAKKVVIDEITVEIDNKNEFLAEKIAENVILNTQLRLSKAENDGLNAAIQDMVAINKENILRMTVLEDDVAAKETVIDEMSMDMKKMNSSCMEIVAENSSLADQVKLFKTKSDGLTKTTQHLESRITNYISEIGNLKSSLQEVSEQNGVLLMRVEEVSFTNNKLNKIKNANEEKNAELLDVVQRITKSLNDEKSHHEKEIEEMKHIFETFVLMSEETLGEVTSQMTAQVSAQRVNIAYLAKSLMEATVDIREKTALLEKKTAEHDDLAEQIQPSNCGVCGYVNITHLVKSLAEAAVDIRQQKNIIGKENS